MMMLLSDLEESVLPSDIWGFCSFSFFICFGFGIERVSTFVDWKQYIKISPLYLTCLGAKLWERKMHMKGWGHLSSPWSKEKERNTINISWNTCSRHLAIL